MKGIIYPNSDIDIYLTEDELTHLFMLEIVKKDGKTKVQHKPLVTGLTDSSGADFGRRVYVQFDDFRELGDGIKVSLQGEGYTVIVNNHAQELLEQRGQFGTRYGAGEKITLYISGRN